ncbi:MAG: alpha/beta hydrolase [Clostridia bacterium]|nr:alpha/beta hydrolase [Clostridia bacterium]
MYTERKVLSPDGKYYVDIYVQNESPEIVVSHLRPMVVVLPGGGYVGTSDREAEPVALAYAAAGFNTAVVRYSVGQDAVWPNPQADVSAALKYIRDNAARFLTDPRKIALCGFSAGGHLAASLGVHWDDNDIRRAAGISGEENRPDALVLCYPVINDAGLFADPRMMGLLLRGCENEEARAKLFEYVCCDRYVDRSKTPPTFIFSTWEDNLVPIANSLDFAAALNKAGVPAEVHIFQTGAHGMSLGDFRTYFCPPNLDAEASEWISLSCSWLWKLFGPAI